MTTNLRERLIVFTRFPEPGKAKTRLIPALGPEGAAELHREMADATVSLAGAACAGRDRELEIRYQGADSARIRDWLGEGLACREQGEGDLGDKMASAFHAAVEEGFDRTVIIGTDCPSVTADIIDEAFAHLVGSDAVLGPATDGGYYLIGLRRTAPALFDGIEWGTESVLAATQQRADAEGLSVVLLELLSDVDRPEDLGRWRG